MREKSACPSCGGSRDDCSDHDKAWYPQREVCIKSQAQAAAQRAWEHKHEDQPWHDGSFTFWAKEYGPATPFHRDDGVTIWVSDEDLTPDDDFI